MNGLMQEKEAQQMAQMPWSEDHDMQTQYQVIAQYVESGHNWT